MASTYVNNLRLNEMATGDGAGTWGTTTNTNLELIGEALGYGTEAITTNADTHTSTVADGSTDAARAMYIKYTGTLDSACTITIGPNTMKRVQFIENATSGSQNIIISQGSGANITIPPGDVKVVYLDGAGSGAAVVDAFASLSVVDLKVQDDLTVTDDLIVNGDIDLEGNMDVNGSLETDALSLNGTTVTSTAAELNILDGVTSTAAEINLLDGSSANTVVNSKAVIYGSSGEVAGTLATAAQPNITSLGTLTGLTTTGDINFGDNDKAIFGAGSDLQIYHTGTESWIKDAGTGNFYIDSNGAAIQLTANGAAENMLNAVPNGGITLYHDNAIKLNTTSTGIDVTGTVTADGLTVDGAVEASGNLTLDGAGQQINFTGGGTNKITSNTSLNLDFDTDNNQSGMDFTISHNGGSDLFIINNSGNVGIGTTSPSGKLEVKGSGTSPIVYFGNGVDNAPNRQLAFSGGSSGLVWDLDATGASSVGGQLTLSTNGSERMRIDSSGNIGIGTDSPSGKIQAVAADSQVAVMAAGDVSDPLYPAFGFDGQIGSNGGRGAGMYLPADGNLAFSTAGSERLRIDNSGNVGIAAVPSGEAAAAHVVRLGDQVCIAEYDDGSNPEQFNLFHNSDSAETYIETGTASVIQQRAGEIIFKNAASGSAGAAISFSERMRIDSSGRLLVGLTGASGFGTLESTSFTTSGPCYLARSSGNVGIGTTSVSASRMQIKGANNTTSAYADGLKVTSNNETVYMQYSWAGMNANDSMKFGIAGSEKMRINSSGQVSIGTTSGLGNLTIGGTSDSARVLPATDNVGYIGESSHRWQAIYAVNGSIQTSDEREKTEIKETTLGLDFIKDLKPVSYKWIDGEQQNKGKDEREHQGLIAQQVAETVEKHGIDKNTFGGLDIQKTEKYDEFYGMSYDQFVAPLIKAIQEQQAQIEALQSEINELKNS